MTEYAAPVMPEHLVARRSAERREDAVRFVAAAITILALAGAGFLIDPINRIRRERQLVIDPRTVKGLPPDMALLGKLGTFRALAIDWAFIRADRLKEEGKYYEAYELHKTICKLAPRFAAVWDHAAWNMAYNISVAQYTPEARWQWVHNGLKILRDEGIKWNPKSVTLYKALGWTYWHKIADFLDDEHLNYKKILAVDMERVLGAPPVVLADEEYLAWFRKIVDAPSDLNRLVDTDPEMARLASRLGGLGLKPDTSLLDFVARHLRPELRERELTDEPTAEDEVHARRIELLSNPNETAAVERLLAAVRRDVLVNDLNLDPAFMYELMTRYGPLDWRNAISHSLYWTSLGDREAEGHINLNRSDLLNNARLVFFGLNTLVMRGRIVLYPDFDDPFDSYIEMLPDTRFIPYTFDTYMQLGKKYYGDDPRFVEGTPGPNYMNGFVTNMHNWVQMLFLEGGETNLALAENYFAWLRQFNPHPDGSTQEQYQLTVEEFVFADILDQMSTFKAASGILRALVDRSLKYLCLGQRKSGVAALVHARKCYKFWMDDTKIDINDRRRMQPFELIVRDQLDNFLRLPQVDALFKARLWKDLPLEWRQMVSDSLRPYFETLCAGQTPPWSIQAAFPEPPGMEEYRMNPIITRGERREDIEQGEGKK